MTRFIAHVVILLSLAVLPLASQAEASTVVTWDSPAPDAFNSGRFTFAGFTANALTSIAGPGFYQDGGENRTFSMELQLDGAWTVIGSSEPSFGSFAHEFLSGIDGPNFFTTALVTGIGFFVNEDVVNFASTTSLAQNSRSIRCPKLRSPPPFRSSAPASR